MDFTREPIIETVITPKEGHKLVIRSSKSTGQEEYFVDAVEIVNFGNAMFFRSLERPKAFLAPVSDFEVLEVREARVVLKNVGHDRSIKIGGGREGGSKIPREQEKEEIPSLEEKSEKIELIEEEGTEPKPELRLEKKRDRRRNYRKRRGKEEGVESASPLPEEAVKETVTVVEGEESSEPAIVVPPPSLSSLLQPPPTLISETINRYRQNEQFKGAFYFNEDEQYKPHDKVQELLSEDDEEEIPPHLQSPRFDFEEPASAPEEPPHYESGSEEMDNGERVMHENAEDENEHFHTLLNDPEEEVLHHRTLPPPPPPLENQGENNEKP